MQRVRDRVTCVGCGVLGVGKNFPPHHFPQAFHVLRAFCKLYSDIFLSHSLVSLRLWSSCVGWGGVVPCRRGCALQRYNFISNTQKAISYEICSRRVNVCRVCVYVCVCLAGRQDPGVG